MTCPVILLAALRVARRNNSARSALTPETRIRRTRRTAFALTATATCTLLTLFGASSARGGARITFHSRRGERGLARQRRLHELFSGVRRRFVAVRQRVAPLRRAQHAAFG